MSNLIEAIDQELASRGIDSPSSTDTSGGVQFTGTTGRSATNNNMLNLERRPGSYQDKYGAEMEPVSKSGKQRFAKFPTMEAGYMAGLDQIRLDASRGHTLASFVNKFAPPHENPTAQITQQYARALGVSPDTPLSEIPAEKVIIPMMARESSTRMKGQMSPKAQEYYAALKSPGPRQQGRAFEPYQTASAGAQIPGPPSNMPTIEEIDAELGRRQNWQPNSQNLPNVQAIDRELASRSAGGGVAPKQTVQEDITTGQQIARTVSPYARPVLELGGMALGGITAGSGSMGLGAALGAGLGYASGKKAADLLDTYSGKQQPESLGQSFLNTGKDVAIGTGMELGGQALGVIGKSVGEWMSSKVAPKLYESALKIPPVSVPPEIRNQVVQKGMEGKYYPNKATLDRLKQENFGLVGKINGEITDAANIGKTIDTEKVLSRVDELGKFYKNLPDPRPYMEQLDKAKQSILDYRGQTIPVDVAQQIKKNLYVNLRNSYGEMTTISKEFDKSVARGIKEELENQIPELSGLNKSLSEKINLEQVLTRAVHRVRNYDVIRLGDTVAAVAGGVADGPQGLGLAFLAKRVLEAPQVKSYLAFLMNRAGGLSAKTLAPIVDQTIPIGFTAVPFANALSGKPRE